MEMQYLGEIMALTVAVSWTVTAMVGEVASKRIGPQVLNVWRMVISMVLLALTLRVTTGSLVPLYADSTTWLWLLASGAVGYVFGDFCLFNSYLYIGSRWGQLFMMLAPIAATITAWAMLGETLELQTIWAIVITIGGIALSVLNRQVGTDGHHHHHIGFKLPLRGVLYGIGAGVGQGVGLVLSKVGMSHYEQCIPQGMEAVSDTMPFASTMIRTCAGLVGLLLVLIVRGDARRLPKALHDGKGMLCTVIASVTGPFIGVSLSLMALLYTSAGVAQTLMSLTPILILWPSRIFFHQRITRLEILGAIISMCGVALFFL